ncbi:hypothetical protein EX30DRAFT_171195 [Ascodesmis nigricans]|uniref:Uncharacterized protein n=1 Tax=Ascodesmis nigricans TaxID=341454 RepID=A0A4S2MLT0_9PEZI|nr:hypothetical protein EX30DRAFT_171195 [Ascodesmis nigricans]
MQGSQLMLMLISSSTSAIYEGPYCLPYLNRYHQPKSRLNQGNPPPLPPSSKPPSLRASIPISISKLHASIIYLLSLDS